jgi:hypothetical protein
MNWNGFGRKCLWTIRRTIRELAGRAEVNHENFSQDSVSQSRFEPTTPEFKPTAFTSRPTCSVTYILKLARIENEYVNHINLDVFLTVIYTSTECARLIRQTVLQNLAQSPGL